MRFLIATTQGASDRLKAPLLGMPVGLRVLLTALDAGASHIEVAGPSAEDLLRFARDGRVTIPVSPFSPAKAERVVVDACAIVAPDLLRALRTGEALVSDADQLIAARRVFEPGDKPSTPLAGLPVLDVPKNPRLFALYLQDMDDLRRARKLLLESQGEPTDGRWTRWALRPLSRRVTPVMLTLQVAPLVLSLAALAWGLVGAWLFTVPGQAAALLGLAVTFTASLLACVDGEVARLAHRVSPRGAVLNRIVSLVLPAVTFLGLLGHPSVAVAIASSAGGPSALGTLVPFAPHIPAIGLGLWCLAALLSEVRGRALVRRATAGLLANLLHRDTLLALAGLLAVFGWRPAALVLWPVVAFSEALRSLRE